MDVAEEKGRVPRSQTVGAEVVVVAMSSVASLTSAGLMVVTHHGESRRVATALAVGLKVVVVQRLVAHSGHRRPEKE